MTALACFAHTLAGIMQAVLQVNPLDPKYLKHDVTGDGKPETFCNIYLRALLAALGLDIPAVLANELAVWFEGPEARDRGWLECTLDFAKRAAGRGEIAVGALVEPGHGHVLMLVDGDGNATQAGGRNYVRAPLTVCFTPEQLKRVHWFHHP